MKRMTQLFMYLLLMFISAGCSKDSEPEPFTEEETTQGDNDNKQVIVVPELQNKTWVFENKSTKVIDETINYCFHSDGILEVTDNSEYGPLFLESGKYEYEIQLDNKPANDGMVSGSLKINNRRNITFWIGKQDENDPSHISLWIFCSTASSFVSYGFTLKK